MDIPDSDSLRLVRLDLYFHIFRDVDDFDNQPIPGTEGARNPFFSPDGKRVGFFAGTWTRSQISLGHDTWLGGIWSSDTGTLVFVPGMTTGDLQLVWVDRQGRTISAVEGKASFMHPKLSPNDSQVAVSAGSEIGRRQIWIYDLERGSRRLLPCGGSCSAAFWAPGGDDLVFSSNAAGSWDLNIGAVQGTEQPREFVVREHEQWGGFFSPNGRVFAFYDVYTDTGRDIWIFDVEAQQSHPYLVTRINERAPKISSDGRWRAYLSNESGLDEIYVESYPERGRKWTISTAGGTEPLWSKDGTELFYRQGDQVMVVDVGLGDNFSASKPRPLFAGRFEVGVIGNPDYDVTSDGQKFLMVRRDEGSAPVELHVILNWDRELTQLFAAQE